MFLLVAVMAFISAGAQIKISALPSKSGPADQALVPIVEDGVNKKVLGWRLSQSRVDSLVAAIGGKQNSLGFTPVPNTRTISINGNVQQLNADAEFTFDFPDESSTNTKYGDGSTTTFIDAAGDTYTPHFLVSIQGDLAGLGVMANDGSNNRRISLFVDNANNFGGISTAYGGSSFPFMIRVGGSNRFQINTNGTLKWPAYTSAGILKTNSSGDISSVATIAQSEVSGLPTALSTIESDVDAVEADVAALEGEINQQGWVAAWQFMGSAIKAGPIGVDWNSAGTATGMNDGRLFLIPIWVNKTMTLTGIKFILMQAFSGTADNTNAVGLYSMSAGSSTITKVAESTTDGTLWAGSLGLNAKAFSSTYSAARGVYYVAVLYNSSAQTTGPQLLSGATDADRDELMDFGNGHALTMYVTASQSTLPSTINVSSGMTVHSSTFFVYAY